MKSFETICAGDEFLFQGDVIKEAGTYVYNLTTINGCDSILTLNVEELDPKADSLYVEILPGETYAIGNSKFTNEEEYFLSFPTSGNCDSSIVLFLEYLKIFVPNVFSPNGDNINDYFEVSTSNDEYVSKEISILIDGAVYFIGVINGMGGLRVKG